MKRNYLKRGGAIALAVLAGLSAFSFQLSAEAQAPTFAAQTVFSAQTWNAGSSNLASPYVLDVRKQGNVYLETDIRGVTTATNIYAMAWSSDGTHYGTNATDRILWAPDQQTSAVSDTRGTNISVGARGYLIIYNIYGTQTSTNALRYTIKISSP